MPITARSRDWVTFTGFVVQADLDKNCYDAALERLHRIYDVGLPVCVSFSGGKDSTTVLMLTLQVARERGQLPLHVAMVDEEIIDPDTLRYTTDVSQWDDIVFHWLCVPLRHTLRSQLRSHWITWDPDCRDVWARDPPPGAITTYPGIDNVPNSYGDKIGAYFRCVVGWPKKIQIGGIRAEEAFNRRRAVVSSGGFMAKKKYGFWAKPIYDWDTRDVWRAIARFEWAHSKFYDRLWQEGVSLKHQCVAVWGNVAAAKEARYYPKFYPDFWERAIRRLPELKAAARYGGTRLYRERLNKPVGMTWQEYCFELVERLDEDSQDYWLAQIASLLKQHRSMSTAPLQEALVLYGDGRKDLMGWRYLAAAIAKNDRIEGSSRDLL